MRNTQLEPLKGWAAVDVETATRAEGSICQIGVATTTDGITIEKHCWLVRPPGNRYDPEFTRKYHGLTSSDTTDKPTLAAVWEAHVVPVLKGKRILAHNLDFDLPQIEAALNCRFKPAGSRKTPWVGPPGCTLRMAVLLLPDRTKSYKLEALCESYGITIGRHHNAVDDAAAALRLAAALHARHASGSTMVQLRNQANTGWSDRRYEWRRREAYKNTSPATPGQLDFIRRLAARRGIRVRIRVHRGNPTKGEASRVIDILKDGWDDTPESILERLLAVPHAGKLKWWRRWLWR